MEKIRRGTIALFTAYPPKICLEYRRCGNQFMIHHDTVSEFPWNSKVDIPKVERNTRNVTDWNEHAFR
ncbi:hypothetical protein KM043_002885 [Ampulex compressa]|nr:hypothetical protein KM043_002885 [Ampulex compressa]